MSHFVFVDEMSTNLTYCLRYGRSPAGWRLNQALVLHSSPYGTLIAALNSDGLGASLSVYGAVNGNVFAGYFDLVVGIRSK